ncbi:tRNA lysidine(34) synthetase TilS [Staphylococcus hyicus]|nr:tRNA lysidine(34) synthetase TilS [Staphylococcus hyicus]NJI30626.1 tRNA lysidine(34) synthetase TilS [Staphylococcus hyicus]
MKVNWKPYDHIVIAVSTGIDSMVLLHRLLHQYQTTYKQLTVLHVHHGLRHASDKEEGFIKKYCEQHGVSIYVHRLHLQSVVEQGRSIQNDARIARYLWFEEMMHQLDADVLMTAHHFDDLVETVFYRIFTGKVYRSALGMQACEQRQGYRLVRPLLEDTKDDIALYQSTHHVPYFEDDSNQDTKYVRNAIRQDILPRIDAHDHFKSTHLKKLYDMHLASIQLIEQMADDYISIHVKETPQHCEMSLTSFNKCPEHVRMMVLDKLIQKWEAVVPISDTQYQQWFKQITQPVAQIELYATNTWQINKVYDKLSITTVRQKAPSMTQIKTPGVHHFGEYCITVKSLQQLQGPLQIRLRQNGDRVALQPYGHKKVSRLMIDAKVPQQMREHMPVVEDTSGCILAVGTLYRHNNVKQIITIAYLGDENDEK